MDVNSLPLVLNVVNLPIRQPQLEILPGRGGKGKLTAELAVAQISSHPPTREARPRGSRSATRVLGVEGGEQEGDPGVWVGLQDGAMGRTCGRRKVASRIDGSVGRLQHF